MYEIQIIIKNIFGDFKGRKVTINESQLEKIMNVSRDFIKSPTFEITCEDGTIALFPQEIMKKSMILIKKTKK